MKTCGLKRTAFRKCLALLLQAVLLLSVLSCTDTSAAGASSEDAAAVAAQLSTAPAAKPDGDKYHLAYIDYDEYLPASRFFYYISSGYLISIIIFLIGNKSISTRKNIIILFFNTHFTYSYTFTTSFSIT